MTAATYTGPPAPRTRPRLRGWLHFWSFFVSLVTGGVLVAVAATVSGVAVAATAVYAETVVGMFGVSALYHRRTWLNPAIRVWMRRLDHSMIFLLIAGTYTPFTLLAMDRPTGYVVLAVVWTGAVGGVALKMLWPHAPRWLGVPIYLALGWVAVFVFPQLLRHAGPVAFTLLLVGGGFYTLGALCYALRRPDPWPSTFGYHEFFHAATVLAAACQYSAVWFVLYS